MFGNSRLYDMTPIERFICQSTMSFKKWISFFWDSLKYEPNGSRAKYVTPEGRNVNVARDPLRSYFDEPQKKWNSFLIFTFFLQRFYALFSRYLCKVCKLHGEIMLLTNAFGHYFQQPSAWRDVSRTFRQLLKTFVYPWRRFMTTSHDPLTFIDVWALLIQNRFI